MRLHKTLEPRSNRELTLRRLTVAHLRIQIEG